MLPVEVVMDNKSLSEALNLKLVSEQRLRIDTAILKEHLAKNEIRKNTSR